jgi:Xaa-Pro aminopeptidase
MAPPDYASRLQALRTEIKRLALDGFLVPMADEYQSEVVPACARRLAFLSGFTGSSGLIIVMADKAVFFTDGRYTLQASQQVSTKLFTLYDSTQKTPGDWLKENAKAGLKIGFDPWLHTVDAIERHRKLLANTGAALTPVESNPVDAIWTDRPSPPVGKIRAYDLRYAGVSAAKKRASLAEELKNQKIDAVVITDPASIAWLLNVRGDDVPHAPLPLSRAILRSDGRVEWFVDPRKLTQGLEVHLGEAVTCSDMDTFPAALKRLGEARVHVRIDPSEAPYEVLDILQAAAAPLDRGINPCALPKACKNLTELEGMRAAHRRDGAALVKFLSWLDKNAPCSKLTEMVAAEKLEEFRASNNLYRGTSFETIAGAGPNGAIVHYRVTHETNRVLEPDTLFLLDSGGQYVDGTTDVTRTIAIGEPTQEMRDRFTRVLKGHIALASIRFPAGTTGVELDVLARQYLWAQGLDYNHGTGHGVGSYLSVHEGPQSISHRGHAELKPGMVLSNEPGYYKPDHYGIRIENLQAVVEAFEIGGASAKMLGFEPLTLVPIDKRLIVMDMLTGAERDWLNAYHARTHEALRPQVDEATEKWLKAATEAL